MAAHRSGQTAERPEVPEVLVLCNAATEAGVALRPHNPLAAVTAALASSGVTRMKRPRKVKDEPRAGVVPAVLIAGHCPRTSHTQRSALSRLRPYMRARITPQIAPDTHREGWSRRARAAAMSHRCG
jgi:hypothetical protein